MDERFMKEALKQAKKAEQMGEVPIGAVIVKNGKIIARAYNKREKAQQADAHAEMLALRKACRKLENWRLSGCTLYVTLEPCPMCTGAMINARADRIVFGAPNPQSGACGTRFDMPAMHLLNHTPAVSSGVMLEECKAMMTSFFKAARKRNKKC